MRLRQARQRNFLNSPQGVRRSRVFGGSGPLPKISRRTLEDGGIASTVSLLIFRPGPERRQQDGTADPPAVIAVRALRIASPFRKTPYAAHAPEHPDARARRPT